MIGKKCVVRAEASSAALTATALNAVTAISEITLGASCAIGFAKVVSIALTIPDVLLITSGPARNLISVVKLWAWVVWNLTTV